MDFRQFPFQAQRKPVDINCQILEGIATILIAIVAAGVLPADLASATFLTQEERECASKVSININI